MIRLGRVCYIVKESSIELGEQAMRIVESYALKKNKEQWDSLANVHINRKADTRSKTQGNVPEDVTKRTSSAMF